MQIGHARTLAAASMLLVLSACASVGDEFSGEWGYAQSCGWAHTASLRLVQKGDSVTGTWDDGTRVRGEDGRLEGQVREGKAYVRFCTEGKDSNAPEDCLNFGEVSAYLQRIGSTLAWHRKSGSGFTPYLVLHPADGDKPVPIDTACGEDATSD